MAKAILSVLVLAMCLPCGTSAQTTFSRTPLKLYATALELANAQSDYPPQQLLDQITAQGIRAHMEFLADDLLEGRGTGTSGYQLAANYVRARFEQMGLEPAGEAGTYFQNVHLRQLTPVPERDSFLIRRGNAEDRLVFEKDYLMAGNPAQEDSSVDAPLVFVGYGVTAPEKHYDDYAGIDANGKIVVIVTGAPASFGSSERAVYSDGFVKARNAAGHGAIGMVGIWAGDKKHPVGTNHPFFSPTHNAMARSERYAQRQCSGDKGAGICKSAYCGRAIGWFGT